MHAIREKKELKSYFSTFMLSLSRKIVCVSSSWSERRSKGRLSPVITMTSFRTVATTIIPDSLNPSQFRAQKDWLCSVVGTMHCEKRNEPSVV